MALACCPTTTAAKLAAKGLPPNVVFVAGLIQRRAVFEVDWERRLAHLLFFATSDLRRAWQSVLELVTALQVSN